MIYMIIYITYYDIRQIGNMFICSQLIFFFVFLISQIRGTLWMVSRGEI